MLFFYDTNSLLDYCNEIIISGEPIYFSSITYTELEGIKNNRQKSDEIRSKAKKLTILMDENKEQFKSILFRNSFLEAIKEYDFPDTPDTKIVATFYAFMLNEGYQYPSDKKIFVTKDRICSDIAEAIGIPTQTCPFEPKPEYTGYLELQMDEADMAKFYNEELIDPKNIYGLVDNQYLIIKQKLNTENGEKWCIIDKYKYTKGQYAQVSFIKFESKMFGKVVNYHGDHYQQIAMDSLKSNQLTMIKGPAGTGKSYLAVGYLFSLLERGIIDRIVIFCNTIATRGSAKLGYYPGTKDEKLLDSQIGNFLTTKLGDKTIVEKMIEDGTLWLLPLSDVRGFDTDGLNCGVYITEAQNMDIELMRLSLQRVSENCPCVILDGDCDAQVDDNLYAGSNNGMRRVSEVFKGEEYYGEVTLRNIYRGRIAAKAQQL